MAIKIMNNKVPHYLFSILQETFYSTRRRPRIRNFYDNSNGKIGRQKLNCKLKCMEGIKFDWLEMDLNDNRLQILHKDTIFSYLQPDKVWQHRIYHIDNRNLAIYFILTFILIH